MFNKLKQVNDIRKQAKAMQSQMAEIVVVGQSRKGVMITIDGNQKVQGVQIEEGLDRETLEIAVKDAFNDAVGKLQKELAAKMRDMGGFDALKGLLG
jgi:DNA-binding protein YbaB